MKTIKHFTVPIAIALLFLTNGCLTDIFIEGNGIQSSESRITKSFTEVASSGEFEVYITQGSDFDVTVIAESNLLPFIETNVRGNTLHVETQGIHSLVNHSPMKIYVTAPYIDGLVLSGSGTISSGILNTDRINMVVSGSGIIETQVNAHLVNSSVSGSGKIITSGNSNNAEFSISGSGRIAAEGLVVGTCEANISGSGQMSINVERVLVANISGSGNIFYTGRPVIETHISGSGRLISQN